MNEPVIVRKYSVSEIDRMRQYVEEMSASYNGPFATREAPKSIELKLRTYLVAGVSPDELRDECKEFTRERLDRLGEVYT